MKCDNVTAELVLPVTYPGISRRPNSPLSLGRNPIIWQDFCRELHNKEAGGRLYAEVSRLLWVLCRVCRRPCRWPRGWHADNLADGVWTTYVICTQLPGWYLTNSLCGQPCGWPMSSAHHPQIHLHTIRKVISTPYTPLTASKSVKKLVPCTFELKSRDTSAKNERNWTKGEGACA